jgi:hypothetical protein
MDSAADRQARTRTLPLSKLGDVEDDSSAPGARNLDQVLEKDFAYVAEVLGS